MALNGLQEALLGPAAWAPYVNSSLMAPNWSNLLESCVRDLCSSSPRAEPLHGNNLALVGMLPGAAVAAMGKGGGGGRREGPRGGSSSQLEHWELFIGFHLMLLVGGGEKGRGKIKS